jgi:hypothetical protein
MSRVRLGVRDEASFLLELSRVDFAASETLLQDFQGVGCCGVGFVVARGTALAATLAAVAAIVAAIFAAAFTFGLGLSLNFLH